MYIKKTQYKTSSKVHESKRQPEKEIFFKPLKTDPDNRSCDEKIKERSCILGECNTHWERTYPTCKMEKCGIYRLLKHREEQKHHEKKNLYSR